jgi:hypothetical protein
MNRQTPKNAKAPKIPRSVDEAAQMLISEFLIQHLQDLANMSDDDFEAACRKHLPGEMTDSGQRRAGMEASIWKKNDAAMDQDEDPTRTILKQIKNILNDFHGLFIIA